jgi:L-lactate permease
MKTLDILMHIALMAVVSAMFGYALYLTLNGRQYPELCAAAFGMTLMVLFWLLYSRPDREKS